MKKTLIALLASATILAPVSAFAADSSGTVAFTDPTSTVTPIDPTQPSDPNTTTGETGPLTIDLVPTLDFGSHEIASGSQTYSLTAGNPEIQASDRRGVGADGSATGWAVSVSMTDFVNGSQKLTGASLSFDAASEVKTSANNTTSIAPTSVAISNLSSASNATPILKASKGQGLGSWYAKYDTSAIKLTVPVASKGTFQSTLTWTMGNGPVA